MISAVGSEAANNGGCFPAAAVVVVGKAVAGSRFRSRDSTNERSSVRGLRRREPGEENRH